MLDRCGALVGARRQRWQGRIPRRLQQQLDKRLSSAGLRRRRTSGRTNDRGCKGPGERTEWCTLATRALVTQVRQEKRSDRTDLTLVHSSQKLHQLEKERVVLCWQACQLAGSRKHQCQSRCRGVCAGNLPRDAAIARSLAGPLHSRGHRCRVQVLGSPVAGRAESAAPDGQTSNVSCRPKTVGVRGGRCSFGPPTPGGRGAADTQGRSHLPPVAQTLRSRPIPA